MTTTPAAGPSAAADDEPTLRLSRLLKRPVADSSGESIGRLADVIVRLRGTDYPLVTGAVADAFSLSSAFALFAGLLALAVVATLVFIRAEASS